MDFEKCVFDSNASGMEIQDIEPLPRERSNTWHGDFMYFGDRLQTFTATPEKVTSSGENATMKLKSDIRNDGDDEGAMHIETSSTRKCSMRRNAWGNASYAELIAQAIEGSPEKRLTLTQIYEWMIKNISYFQMKSDGPSSMGWKNSIRHNLSLHNQFSRVQNEGTGKSSWWIVNRNFVKSRIPRRRATMGDSSLMDRKRCRVNKKVKAQEMEAPSLVDELSRKIRTISEANEVASDNDHKFSTVMKKSNSQTIISSSLNNDYIGQSKADERTAEQVLQWSEIEDVSRCIEVSDLQSSRPHGTCPTDSYSINMTQQGTIASQGSIIVGVQPANAQKNCFQESASSHILFYVPSSEKNKVILTANQAKEHSKELLAMHKQTQNYCSIDGIYDLNKQTNEMSLGESDTNKAKSLSHVSEKRRKMLMELFQSEKFCQLRRQNPELNRKIIEMLQRKKNLLLNKDHPNNEVFDYECHQSFLDSNTRQATKSFHPQSQWLKFDTLDGAQSTFYFPKNESDPSCEKSELFENADEFGQSNHFQIDVDQAIGHMDFDGNIDDLFGTNCLLLNCEDELNILSEFS